LAALALGGCAIGRAERRLDQDLAQAPSPATPAQVRQEVDRAIAEAPNLTDPQRAQLRALRGRSCETLDNLQRQRLALEAALIKELVAPSFDAKEAAAVERRMRDLDSARLSLLFDAVAKANAILGREASRHEKLIQALMRENRYSSASDPLLNR
jgi:Spy/CpxP family protein refolding chaperone